MKNKKTKIKIKRSKVNLYNKKKNRKKQVAAIIITAAAACALCILGYGIGKPLMDYFRNRDSIISSSTMWTPEGSEALESSSDASSAPVQSSSSAPVEQPKPAMTKAAYFLSEEAALSSTALNSEISAAKAAGHSVIVVTLKDGDGMFLYKTAIEKVQTKGTLTASQIASEIEKAGLIPAAMISTLKDKTNGVALGCCYKFEGGATWLDGRPGVGKTWLSPFDEKTGEFVKAITSELSEAGFKRIVAVDTMYPSFYSMDISENLAHLPLSDRTKRAEALWNVIASAKEGCGEAELYIEMDGSKLIASRKDGTNAEMAFTPERLKTANLIIDYSPSESDPYAEAQKFVESLKTALDGAECVVRIKGNSQTAIESVKKAFDEAKIEAFSQ